MLWRCKACKAGGGWVDAGVLFQEQPVFKMQADGLQRLVARNVFACTTSSNIEKNSLCCVSPVKRFKASILVRLDVVSLDDH